MTNLRIGAEINRISVSEYIRRLLNNKTEKDKFNRTMNKKKNPLWELVKIAENDPKPKKLINISGNVDKYLPEELR